MKIGGLHIVNHPFFGTMDIDFTDPDQNPLNTVVLAGINGSGKTTLLQFIQEVIRKRKIMTSLYRGFVTLISPETGEKNYVSDYHEDHTIIVLFTHFESDMIKLSEQNIANGFKDNALNPFNKYLEKFPDENQRDFTAQLPKIIFLPSEVNFNTIEITNKPYSYKYRFFNQLNENIAKSIPDYFGTLIDKKVYENEDIPPKESIRQVCKEINAVFEKLELESEIIGLKKDGSRMPVFRNKSGKEFDITGLSSGEKQLFFRVMSLKMLEANNSIILVDEPEISLHPAWQQKILKVYENIGKNNQVIVATHSPHIIASTAKENVKILVRNEDAGTFHIMDYHNIHVAKGAPAERILKDLMGLPTTRDPEIQEKIDFLWELIHQGVYETEAFTSRYDELEELLGTIDEDMVLMKMEIGKKKWETKKNAEN